MQSQRTATGCPGKVPLDKDRRRYCLLGTDSNPVRLVNPRVTERRAEVPPPGVNFNAPPYPSPGGPKSPGRVWSGPGLLLTLSQTPSFSLGVPDVPSPI